MPRPIIPVIEDVTVGRFVLRDLRTVDRQDRRIIQRSFEKHLETWLVEFRPGTHICAHDTPSFHRHLKRLSQAGVNVKDMKNHPYEPEDETDLNPELATLTFGVYNTQGRLRGAFNFYNIRIQSSDSDAMRVSAMPCPAFTTSKGTLHPDDTGLMMQHLMEDVIQFRDSERVLDVNRYRFPLRPTHLWLNDDDSLWGSIQLLKDRGHQVIMRVSSNGRNAPRAVVRQ